MAAAGHRTARLFARHFYVLILLYGLWTIWLILWRNEPLIGNRQIGYTGFLVATAFAGPGMILIASPLRAYVLGSRLAVILSVLVTLYLSLGTSVQFNTRIGIGNDAVFAFVAAIAAVAAASPLVRAPRFLPDGPWWLWLGLIPVALSQTRSVLAPLLIVAGLEALRWLYRLNWRQRGIALASMLVLAGAAVSVGPGRELLSNRLTGFLNYTISGDSSDYHDQASDGIRPVLWHGAGEVIKAHPVAGVGAYFKMDLVRDAVGETTFDIKPYLHVHNMFLDELLQGGIVGLCLLVAAFGALAVFLFRTLKAQRLPILYFGLVWIGYGMYHNPMLHEVSISAIMLFLAAHNAEASKALMRAKRA